MSNKIFADKLDKKKEDLEHIRQRIEKVIFYKKKIQTLKSLQILPDVTVMMR